MQGTLARLAVNRFGFLRPDEKRRLLAAVETGLRLERLGLTELEFLVGRLLRAREWQPRRLVELASRDLDVMERLGIRLVHEGDPEYPPLLREIHDPPFALYLRGGELDNARPSLAIVGTRRASGRGEAAAGRLAAELAESGIPILSGLARGIDAAAHRGALAARRRGGSRAAPTIAVLPVGIEAVYPPSHRGLAAAILDFGGSLLSEYPPGTPATTYRFPERNRIIAGMARGTLVVEAPARSGALITSDHALDAGRDVFVADLPEAGNEGASALRRDGAPVIGGASALIGLWNLEPPRHASARTAGGLAGAGWIARSLQEELGLETPRDIDSQADRLEDEKEA